ncbi:MAG: hypothetical protein RIR79_576 [Pseudomonadota bacterium]
MKISTLIDKAIEVRGSRKDVAEGLKQDPQRLTDWKAGRRKPDANEIAYLAECAGLPVLETVAEVQAELNDRYASIWRKALEGLKSTTTGNGIVAEAVRFELTDVAKHRRFSRPVP